MSSRTTQQLFQLIHSLSPHEKRYFKLYAGISGKKDNNYLDLFDILNEQAAFDEDQLLARVAGKRYASHLPTTVHHLFQLILRSLRSFAEEGNALNRLRALVESCRILLRKAQYAPAARMLRRARKKAEALQHSALMLEILELEKQVTIKTTQRKLLAGIQEQLESERTALRHLNDEVEIAALHDMHLALRRINYRARTDAEKAQFAEILAHPLVAAPDPPASFKASRHFHSIHGHNALMQRDYETAYAHFSAIIEGWQAHPEIMRMETATVAQDMAQLLNACMYAMQWDEAEKLIVQIDALPSKTRNDQITRLNQSCYAQLFYCVNTGAFEAGTRLIAEIEQLLRKHGAQLNPARHINFHYNITIFHFVNGNFAESLRWLNALLTRPKTDLRQNIQDFARIFQVVLHYERGNYDLVEYLYRSTYRYYRSHREIHRFEELIFEAIKQLIAAAEADRPELYQGLYDALWGQARNPDGKEPPGMYEMIFWVQSKVTGRPLQDVYAQRVRERFEKLAGKDIDEQK